MSVELGSLHRLTYEVRDAIGALTAASTVTLVVTRPDGTTTGALTPSTSGTGLYFYDFPAAMAGRHVAAWVSTGPTTANSDVFNVATPDAGWIVSRAQVRSHLNLTLSTSDEELELMIASATEKIEDQCGPVVRRTVTGERHPGGGHAVRLHQAPVLSVTSVTSVTTGAAVSPALLDVDPDTGRVTYLDGYSSFPWGPHLWSYVAGRQVVPAGLQLAALNYIRGSWETQRGPAGLPLQGGPDELAAQPGMGLVNWRLEQDLAPFTRLPGGA